MFGDSTVTLLSSASSRTAQRRARNCKTRTCSARGRQHVCERLPPTERLFSLLQRTTAPCLHPALPFLFFHSLYSEALQRPFQSLWVPFSQSHMVTPWATTDAFHSPSLLLPG